MKEIKKEKNRLGALQKTPPPIAWQPAAKRPKQ
jgi:hypothetical protein